MKITNQLFRTTAKSSERGTLTQSVREFAARLSSEGAELFIQKLNQHLSEILDDNCYSGIRITAEVPVSACIFSFIDEINFRGRWDLVIGHVESWEEQLNLWSTHSIDYDIVGDSYCRDNQVPLEIVHKIIFLLRYLARVAVVDFYGSDLDNDMYSYLVLLISVCCAWEDMNHENEL